jgi:hypothetical protein
MLLNSRKTKRKKGLILKSFNKCCSSYLLRPKNCSISLLRNKRRNKKGCKPFWMLKRAGVATILKQRVWMKVHHLHNLKTKRSQLYKTNTSSTLKTLVNKQSSKWYPSWNCHQTRLVWSSVTNRPWRLRLQSQKTRS